MKKRILPLLLSLALCASLTVPALADNGKLYTIDGDKPSIKETSEWIYPSYPGDENNFKLLVAYVPLGTTISFISQSSETVLDITFFYEIPGSTETMCSFGQVKKDGTLNDGAILESEQEPVEVGYTYHYTLDRPNQMYDATISCGDASGQAHYMRFVTTDENGVLQPMTSVCQSNALLDGKDISLTTCLIPEENGNSANYVMLRDVANLLSGTAAQFEVSWSAAAGIALTTGVAYTPTGQEGNSSGDYQIFTPGTSAITVNGKSVALTAYAIKGNNYFKLRDLGSALGFNVDWDKDKGVVILDSNAPYSGAN